MSMKTVLLFGYYGTGNIGDECMRSFFIDNLLINNNLKKLYVFSYSNYSEKQNTPYESIYINDPFPIRYFKTLLGAIFDSDIVIWGGGSCFTDYDGDGNFFKMVLCKLLGKKIYYLSVGIDNLQHPVRVFKTKLLLKMADFIVVRDLFSKKFVQSVLPESWNKVDIVQDVGEMVISQHKNFDIKDAGNTNRIIVAWRNFNRSHSFNHNEMFEILSQQILKFSQSQHCDVEIIDCDNECDNQVGRDIASYFQDQNINYRHSPLGEFEDKIQKIKSAKFVFTSRLHVAVVALYAGIPVFLYDYSQKTTSFAKKYSQSVFLIKDISAFSADDAECFCHQFMPADIDSDDILSEEKKMKSIINNIVMGRL